MHAVILGAGTVGTSIAELLCAYRIDVCVVDANREILNRVEEQLDVQTVTGSACEVVPLFQAGVQSADLCLAVTSHDEVNLVGASLAKAMGTRKAVARIFNPAYRDFSTFDYQRHFQIDRLVSLERLTALELAKGLHGPGLFAVENFARGGIQVQEVGVDDRSRVRGTSIRDLGMPNTVRIGLIANAAGVTLPTADYRLQAGDRVTLIGTQEVLESVSQRFVSRSRARQSIIIAGGGEIGMHLAHQLDPSRYRVSLLEADPARCRYLSARLDGVTVLTADATLRSELEEARVGTVDVFISTMGRDEDNIVCGVEARQLGAKRILGVVRRPDYVNVLERLGIDMAVSPREVMAREVLGMVAAGPIARKSPIAGGAAEVWEVIILPGAASTGGTLRELQIPDCLVAAIVREEYVKVASGDDQLRVGDTAVIIVQSSQAERAIRWFQSPSEG